MAVLAALQPDPSTDRAEAVYGFFASYSLLSSSVTLNM